MAIGQANITIEVDITEIDVVLFWSLFSDPLAKLALAFRQINPHWYLNGDKVMP